MEATALTERLPCHILRKPCELTDPSHSLVKRKFLRHREEAWSSIALRKRVGKREKINAVPKIHTLITVESAADSIAGCTTRRECTVLYIRENLSSSSLPFRDLESL